MRPLPRSNRRVKPRSRSQARLGVELLEGRLLLDGNGLPAELLPFSSGYLNNWVGPGPGPLPVLQATGTGGLPAALEALLRPGVPAGPGPLGPEGPGTPAETDPGALGPLAFTVEEYDFGNNVFTPTGPGYPAFFPVELTARIYAPTDLTGGPRPLILFMHGRHGTSYTPPAGGGTLTWPPGAGQVTIPSYQGYDYIGEVLASHGYIVASVSANGVNSRDQGTPDLGMLARAQLLQRHLDLWADFNRDGVTPFGEAAFGTRFVGKVDLQNVGTMGHSRGGEGVVRHFILNQSLGSPYGIRAVFPLAPVDFQRPVINNVALGVLLPTNDGDVSDNQGAHFYDDARYNVAGDLAPKHTFQVLGANHNSYNTVWTPGIFPFPGAPSGAGGTGDDGTGGAQGVARLSHQQVRATGLATMAGFFRTYVGNMTVPASTNFLAFLKGDVPAPPSAEVGDDKLRMSYHGPDTAAFRRDVNRLNVASATVPATNTLGGAVTQSGLTPYLLCGGDAPQAQHCIPGSTARQPHTTPSALSSRRGLSQLHLGWTNTTAALWENQLPAGSRNVSGFYALQFRAGINWNDTRNPVGVPQDFSVTLTDGAGRSVSTLVSDSARSLFYPTAGSTLLPKLFLNTVRIPLSIFSGGGVDLTDVRAIRFNFDQASNGAMLITDLAFADPATTYAGPFVMLSTPNAVAADSIPGGLPGQVPGPIRSVRVSFNTPINPATFTTADVVSFTGPGGPITITGVAVVPGKANRQFDLFFTSQSAPGLYTLVLGSNIADSTGNLMDQNFNRTLGEATGDRATVRFRISASASTAEIQVLDGTTDIPDGSGTVDLGSTPLGMAVTRTFTVRNLGTGALSASTLVLSGPITLPAGFTLVSSMDDPDVMPGQATRFTVRLDALTAGAFSGEVMFGTNDSNENPFNFTISGMVAGAAPEIAVLDGITDIPDNTGSVNFGSTAPGMPVSRTFTVRNTGSADLTLTPPISVPSGFTVTSSFGSTTLAPNATTTFTVRLDAGAAGSFSGQLSFGNNDSDENPFNFTISGQVVVPAPEIQVLDGATDILDNTGSVAFGNTPVGTPVSKTFTVRNLGTTNLTLTPPISVPAGFTVTSSFGSTTLAPSATTTFTVRLDALAGGAFSGQLSFGNNDGDENPFNFTISGNVTAEPLRVVEITPLYSGFIVLFNRPLNPASLNLYDGTPGGLGPVDVTLIGMATGPVRGSLVVDPAATRVTFIATGGLLPDDTYSIVLRSAANGFVDTAGGLLDGDGDLMTGDDHLSGFVIVTSPSVIVSAPDVMRGPGQIVDLPAATPGLPLRLTNSSGVTSVSLTLRYNPDLLTITGATVAPGLPPGAAVTFGGVAGARTINFTVPSGLPGGISDFVRLTASVPASAASSYTQKHVLDVTDLVVNEGFAIALDDDGVHVVGYIGDTNASGNYSAIDATQTLRVAVGLDSGFNRYQLADPVIVADVVPGGGINATDATRILQESIGLDQAQIPPLPNPPLSILAAGPDPLLSLPRKFRGRRGSIITVPVNLDLSNGLESANLALSYDTSRLEVVAVRRGRLTRDFDLFGTVLDETAGTISVGLGRSAGPIRGRRGGSVLQITFRIRADAPEGNAIVNLREGVGVVRTYLNEGFLDLNPDPSNTAGDVLDGVIHVIATDVAARKRGVRSFAARR